MENNESERSSVDDIRINYPVYGNYPVNEDPNRSSPDRVQGSSCRQIDERRLQEVPDNTEAATEYSMFAQSATTTECSMFAQSATILPAAGRKSPKHINRNYVERVLNDSLKDDLAQNIQRTNYLALEASVKSSEKNKESEEEESLPHYDAISAVGDERNLRTSILSRLNKVPRDYQWEGYNHIIEERNTIISCETGAGKTLIVSMVIDQFLKEHPKKTIFFMVPTRPLIAQQKNQILSDLVKKPEIVTLSRAYSSYSAKQWDDTIEAANVLIGTPELFRQALVDKGYINLEKVSLIIFDECHHAVRNDPMARFCKDGLFTNPVATAIRIVGLTASFVSGNMDDLGKKRKNLESTLQAKIKHLSPGTNSKKKYEDITDYDGRQCHRFWPEVGILTEDLMDPFLNFLNQLGLEHEFKSLNKCKHVFEQLGFAGLEHFVEKEIFQRTRILIGKLNEYAARRNVYAIDDQSQATCQMKLTKKFEKCKDSFYRQKIPRYSSKLERLIRLLKEIKISSPEDRVIVFVEEKVIAPILSALLAQAEFSVTFVHGDLSDTMRDKHLLDFSDGAKEIMVSTPSLEEGIDVAKVSYVIRFDQTTTTKSHIQGSGRARVNDPTIYLFCNKSEVEEENRKRMEDCAKNQSLSLNKQDLMNEKVYTNSFYHKGIHPYQRQDDPLNPNGRHQTDEISAINIGNCKSLFNSYMTQVMRQAFPENVILTMHETVIREFPREVTSFPVSLKVPTPEGWKEIPASEVDSFWGNLTINTVVDPSSIGKKMTPKTWNNRRFFHYACVYLSRQGHLDGANKASDRAVVQCLRNCEAIKLPSKVTF